MLNCDDCNDKNYPRPDFIRSKLMNLNGEWGFEFDDENLGEKENWFKDKEFSMKINVPFVYQSELSGINKREDHEVIWYEKKIIIDSSFDKDEIILNFGAVDFRTKIWVNGCFVGEHSGGYTQFSFNIKQYVDFQNENRIVVRVEDRGSAKEQPRGKQGWLRDNFGCWYTKYSGIWQTVWLEFVNEEYIESFKLTPDIDNKKLNAKVFLSSCSENLKLDIKVTFRGKEITNVSQTVNKTSVNIDIDVECIDFENGIMLWNPDNPNLYDLTLTLYKDKHLVDEVCSYFGMRKVSIKDSKVLLNNIPIYQKLVLDQGYFEGGFITAKDEEAFLKDISLVKEFGFNGVRKHQKIEDPRFLYLCDKMGLLVWEEMPSPYAYTEKSISYLIDEWQEVIKRDYNHPCIITWVAFNESWGVYNIMRDLKEQSYVKALYHLTKALDGTRPVIDNDGWEHTETDITTIHDYVGCGEELKKVYINKENVVNGIPSKLFPRYVHAAGNKYENQPVILSEYGGIAFSLSEGWGYNGKVKDGDEFINRFKSLTEAIKDIEYICGYCYTQLTDVEQEQNGLLTINRIPKIKPEIIKMINEL